MSEINMILQKLKLSEKWLEYYILCINDVYEYYRETQNNDTISEHAPLYFISNYLANKKIFTTKEFYGFIDFCLNELDSEDLREVCSWLLDLNTLNMDMLKYLNTKNIIKEHHLDKLYNRAKLIYQLEHHISDKVIHLAIQSQDSVIQKLLLQKQNSNQDILHILLEQGANKKIRNITKQQLKRLNKGQVRD